MRHHISIALSIAIELLFHHNLYFLKKNVKTAILCFKTPCVEVFHKLNADLNKVMTQTTKKFIYQME